MLETVLTVVSGVVVFILGQLIVQYFFRPAQRYKEIKSKIAYLLIYYANVYSNPAVRDVEYKESYYRDIDEASMELRKAAADCGAFGEGRHKYAPSIPKKECLTEAAKCLLLISNNMNPLPESVDIHIEETKECVKIIKTKLKISDYDKLT